MSKKYYFENTQLNNIYSTIWYGELLYQGNQIPISLNYYQNSNKELDDILVDNLGANFYVNLINNNIYISLCSDTKFYYYDFEKKIKNTISKIEDFFKIDINSGNFNADELKHDGNKLKYNISKNKDNKIILRKKILNWLVYESKKKKLSENIIENFENLEI